MSLENNDNVVIIDIIEEKNFQINNDTSIKIKNLIKNLLQNSLGTSLLKLESKTTSDFSTLKLISKNFDEFSKKINFFHKKVEENIKKKEKEKAKKLNLKKEKNININTNNTNNNKKRTLSSNSIKISFNKKINKTIISDEDIGKISIKKKLNTVERKNISSNKLQLRTISNFRNIKKENEKEKSKGKEILIESYKSYKSIKSNEITNLKKYKTSINKNIFKQGIFNKNENSFNINKISHKKIEISSANNNSTLSNKIRKGMNYSYDKTDRNSLSDIEEKIEKKIINNNSILRKNKFKEKEDKIILINKNKPENKNEKKGNNLNINKKKKNIINSKNENINSKKDINKENTNNSNTLSTDLEIKHSKTNFIQNNNTTKPISISQMSEDKKDLQMISVEKIVKLVDDVNQSINKILLDGSQSQFQRRSSIREGNRSFIINKNNEIKEFLNKSPENNKIEKDKIKEYAEIPIPNSSKNIMQNLNLKCKINYNVLSNDLINKKSSRKIKVNNENSNFNDFTTSTINKKNFNKEKENEKEKEIKNYNSYKNTNKKSIKKIILKSNKFKNKNKDKENEKHYKNNESEEKPKISLFKEEDKENNIDFIDVMKDNSKILNNILQFLPFKNKIYFLSINKLFSKERINLLINKREELNIILQLKENETIDDKIKYIKNNSNYSHNKKESLTKEEFKLSKNCIKNLRKLNEEQNLKLFKENQINNNKITEINIIYRILLLFFDEKKLVEISDDTLFWKNCCNYLKDKGKDGKIGNFIINHANSFCFDHHTINLIESILIGNKNNILNGYYEKLCKTTGLIIPLIKEALEYCGILNISNNDISGKILDNLLYNKKLINKLDDIINKYPSK